MIGPRGWGLGAGAALIGGLVAMSVAALAPVTDGPRGGNLHRPPPTSTILPRPYPAESLAAAGISRDLFRIGRRPSPVAFDPAQEVTAPPPAVPKPVLSLLGIVAGADPTAVVQGFPSVEGARVVRVGDLVSGITVATISVDHVKLIGMDTTWVLKVREPWKGQ